MDKTKKLERRIMRATLTSFASMWIAPVMLGAALGFPGIRVQVIAGLLFMITVNAVVASDERLRTHAKAVRTLREKPYLAYLVAVRELVGKPGDEK